MNTKTNNLTKNLTKNNNLVKNIGKQISTMFTLKLLLVLTLIIICIIILIVIARNALFITNMNNHLSPIFILDDIDARNLDNDLITNAGKELSKLHNHTNFSFSTWIYIQDWSYNNNFYKVLFRKSYQPGCNFVPLIALDRYDNNLIFAMNVYNDNAASDTSSSGSMSIVKCVHKNIPLQKWVNIIYLVSDRYVSLYINGNIEKRCHFDTIFCQKSDDAGFEVDILGKGISKLDTLDDGVLEADGLKGFAGKISKMQYFSKHLSTDEIRKIYENGPYIS